MISKKRGKQQQLERSSYGCAAWVRAEAADCSLHELGAHWMLMTTARSATASALRQRTTAKAE